MAKEIHHKILAGKAHSSDGYNNPRISVSQLGTDEKISKSIRYHSENGKVNGHY